MRRTRSLAGQWGLQLDPAGTLTPTALQPDRQVTVPLPIQTEHSDLHQYTGYCWYSTTFNLDEAWLAGDLLLHFGAVDYWCQVYVNGECVGEHEGGYTPFQFSIQRAARPGDNSLAVRVYDASQSGVALPRWWHDPQPLTSQPPFDAAHMPHGKQTWYVDVSGIWQAVTLIARPVSAVQAVRVTPDIHGNAAFEIEIAHPQPGTLTVTVEGQSASIPTTSEQTDYALHLTVPEPRLWTMDTPHLYTARAELVTEAGTDVSETRFGFREIAAHDGKLWLNGQPIYLVSALDQDIYPDTIYTPPSEAFLRDQFEKAKTLGLNSLRCHIKPPDPRYLELADEIGLLIWAEIPSWRTWWVKTTTHPAALHFDETLKNRVRHTLRDMIARDYNHPSLMIWTMVNEDWGTALQLSAADRAFVGELYDLCRQLDPTRLCVDNSPCPAPWGYSPHVRTDINDFHIYTNIPDQAETFDQFIQAFAQRPAWTFSLYGDAAPKGDEPIILSEFGNWGLPTLEALAPGREPDWFDLGPWWNPYEGEPGFPKGVEARFKALGLNAIWPDYAAFAQATQWHQFYAMKYEIEAMRRQPTLAGYVITELSDIYWESNGLLDFARGQKVYHHAFRQFNNEDVILPRLPRFAAWDDKPLPMSLSVSHYSAHVWQNATVTAVLHSGDQSQAMPSIPLADFARGETERVGAHRWTLIPTEAGRVDALRTAVTGADGALLAQNETPILVLPAAWREAAYREPVTVITKLTPTDPALTPGGTLGAPHLEAAGGIETATAEHHPLSAVMLDTALERLGYQVNKTLGDARLLVADHASREMLAWVRAGGDLLLISTGANPFFWQQARGGVYGGSWITTYSWLRTAAYKRLNGSLITNPLSLPFMDIMPQSTLLGMPVTDPAYQADFLAGQVGGWVRHPAVHTVQFRLGRGRVILTTFHLSLNVFMHPVAAAMLHDLVDHLTSEACQPNLTLA
ncbi:MAG: glycoside hydrolase family 2 TIM barrel-domain containing protein [bacterium]|nr:glycoside hydrolase family 2 TIM barrel-domain containing protein [bacterium]